MDDLVASGEEIGAQVAAYLDGELVVDAWAGTADAATGTPVAGDTLFHSYSTGKGMAATVVAWLVDRGLLEYEAPVARYWPEFGVSGKERTTVGHVLSHTAGLPYVRPDLSPEELFDTSAMVAWLADRNPYGSRAL
ncbi:MAG: beta-lactamase family protein [Streptomycetaceae bacterium]|nr:beta-lactamase family protein [Streptomycetaceae bacterium]